LPFSGFVYAEGVVFLEFGCPVALYVDGNAFECHVEPVGHFVHFVDYCCVGGVVPRQVYEPYLNVVRYVFVLVVDYADYDCSVLSHG